MCELMIVIVVEGHSSEAEIEFLELWRRRWNVQRVGPPNRKLG